MKQTNLKKKILMAGALSAMLLASLTIGEDEVHAAEKTAVSVTIEQKDEEKVVNFDEVVSQLKGTQKKGEDDRGAYNEYAVNDRIIKLYDEVHIAYVDGVEEAYDINNGSTGELLPGWTDNPSFEENGVRIPLAFAERILNIKIDGETVVKEDDKESKEDKESEESEESKEKEETEAVENTEDNNAEKETKESVATSESIESKGSQKESSKPAQSANNTQQKATKPASNNSNANAEAERARNEAAAKAEAEAEAKAKAKAKADAQAKADAAAKAKAEADRVAKEKAAAEAKAKEEANKPKPISVDTIRSYAKSLSPNILVESGNGIIQISHNAGFGTADEYNYDLIAKTQSKMTAKLNSMGAKWSFFSKGVEGYIIQVNTK